jgi:peptide chain release factor
MTFITQQKLDELESRRIALGVRREDVIEKFVRSGGAGGQNVNKVSTAVYLKHIPTGLEVKFQQERSQALNRFLAWRLLLDKIAERITGEKSRRRQAIEKIRRQKRKRSRRAKERILEAKKFQSAKKQFRRTPASQ